MIHPHTELRFIKKEIGYGVVATSFIPRGTITWVRDDLDQVFTPRQMHRKKGTYGELLEKYCFLDRHGHWVLCWDLARYLNHSCEASCMETGFDFEIAVRDIAPGEELTDDYGTLNISAGFVCQCGSHDCRRHVYPDDPLRLAEVWDRRTASAFGLLSSVPQPLWRWVKHKRTVEAVSKGTRPLPSSITNYYPAPERPPELLPTVVMAAESLAGAS
jgi:hypothetical protein